MRTVLITGARKGIGRYLAETYLARGDRVIGCSRRPSDLQHEYYTHTALDVADDAAVTKLVRATARTHGLDVLLNNAGVAAMNALLLTPTSTARKLLETNVVGGFVVLREAAKAMARLDGGRIVNFSSVAHPLSLEGEALYAASKAAIESLTRTAARELAPHSITVNAVGPTPIETDLIRAVPKEKLAALLQRQAIPRFGTLADVRNAVDFFLAPESDFITGQVIYLGGVHG